MNSQYAQALLTQPRSLFHTQDLAVLWGIEKANTLHTTIKRYCQSGTLRRIHKGLYATVDLKTVNPLTLGLALIHGYAYLSCESVLQRGGILSQIMAYHSFVGMQSRRYQIAGQHYRCRQLALVYLFNDYGVEKQDGVPVASVARSIADLWYFNPTQHFDAPIPFKEIHEVQKRLGYPLTRTCG